MFAWNCRGLGKSRTVRELTNLARSCRPKVIGLLETKIDKGRLDRTRINLGFKHGLVVDRVGIAWGLALWWVEEMDIHVFN